MIKANITSEESVLENLNTWCFEVGDRFEQMSIDAAHEFINYINDLELDRSVCDLGCGDGAATKVFYENNFKTIAVDINEEKLNRVPGPKINSDILTVVKFFKKINNVFSHHSFEHYVNIDEVIKKIGEKMYPGSLYYVIVPAGDYLHSVHHVVFESPEELLPEGFKPLKLEKQFRDEMEYVCVAQKLV